MDVKTLLAYNENAAAYAKDWLEQPAPDDMYALLQQYFRPGLTVDIGCGAGREVAWLAANNYDVIGYDGSDGLLEQARLHYPRLHFEKSVLPALEELGIDRFQNVLCETVIMHLEPGEIESATKRLLDLLKTGGTLYLSWRVTDDQSLRDKVGRLYAAFDKAVVMQALHANDEVLLDKEEVSASSGKRIHRLIVRKGI